MLVDVVQHQMCCCCVALDVLMLCCCGVSGGLLLCSIWCFDVVLLCSIRCVDVVLLCSIRCDDVASDVLCMQTPIWVTAQSCWHWNKIRRQGGARAATTESTHAERKNLVAERDKFLKWKILVCAVHNIVQVSETKFIRCKIHILNQEKSLQICVKWTLQFIEICADFDIFKVK